MFGMTHFPEDSRHFFRDDGRTPSWEEYFVGVSRGERTQWFSNAIDEGLNEWCSSPAEKKIPVYSGEVVRFQFAKVWTSGAPDKKIQLIALKTLGEQDGRGVTKAQFLSKKGRCGMSWDIYAQWELV
ncbi:hypothetical protein INS49_000536 [Diaporthe citri]|uniref:uncharacterized protein n=1 Tax=Diaporthe citri TaxID=83186 RepID=UPI001C7E6351|nr:uncharacterized protein INS49_000536 [Diaporthe citri]KAG6366359.1 hypothetical protein INS49_000536 [Diaporthe citri]